MLYAHFHVGRFHHRSDRCRQPGGRCHHRGGHSRHRRGHCRHRGGHCRHRGGHCRHRGGHCRHRGGHCRHRGGHSRHRGGHCRHRGGTLDTAAVTVDTVAVTVDTAAVTVDTDAVTVDTAAGVGTRSSHDVVVVVNVVSVVSVVLAVAATLAHCRPAFLLLSVRHSRPRRLCLCISPERLLQVASTFFVVRGVSCGNVALRPAYTIQLLLRRALCRRPTVVGRTRTLSDYAQQVHAHYATKVGSNSVRITAFVADLLKVNVARPSGFQLVNLVVCYHGFHKPEKETCRNKILID